MQIYFLDLNNPKVTIASTMNYIQRIFLRDGVLNRSKEIFWLFFLLSFRSTISSTVFNTHLIDFNVSPRLRYEIIFFQIAPLVFQHFSMLFFSKNMSNLHQEKENREKKIYCSSLSKEIVDLDKGRRNKFQEQLVFWSTNWMKMFLQSDLIFFCRKQWRNLNFLNEMVIFPLCSIVDHRELSIHTWTSCTLLNHEVEACDDLLYFVLIEHQCLVQMFIDGSLAVCSVRI